jgi:flagellar biosynthesis chaperone FliJ
LLIGKGRQILPKPKLESIRKLYAAKEKSLGVELQRLRAEREQHREQTRALHAMLAQYDAEHSETSRMSAEEIRRFKRFYQQVVDTLAAQDEHARRLSAAEETQRDAWQAVYRQRLGIERVLDKQLYVDRQMARRKERRTVHRPPAAPGWSTLNEDD